MSLFLIKIVLKLKNSTEQRTSIVCSTVCTGLVAAVLLLIVASRGALSLLLDFRSDLRTVGSGHPRVCMTLGGSISERKLDTM